jgi:hypothetical protein
MWFGSSLAGLFITSTLLHLEEDINLLVVSYHIIILLSILTHSINKILSIILSFAKIKFIEKYENSLLSFVNFLPILPIFTL